MYNMEEGYEGHQDHDDRHHDDRDDMSDQEEVKDWCKGNILNQQPHGSRKTESPGNVSTDTEAAKTLSRLTVTVPQDVQPKNQRQSQGCSPAGVPRGCIWRYGPTATP